MAENEEKKEKTTRKGKSKGPKSKFRCSSCSFQINPKETPPNKTWNMIAPMPDKMGRVTLTIMGSFTCPNCSKNLRVALQKIKSDDEISGKSKKATLMSTLQELNEKTSLTDIAKNLGLSGGSVTKALNLLIKKGEVKGTVQGEFFLPDKT
ncbi:MAG: winged helix-turn-helix transcriptional regulator [Candidatus Hodarchaeales archaeon]|jgi:transposase-like protein